MIGLEWMKGRKDETSGWSNAFHKEKGVVSLDLPLAMTIEHDLPALNSRPAQVRAVMHGKSKVWAPKTVGDLRPRSSMKARSKGNVVLLVINLGTLACTEYSSFMFITSQEENYRKNAASNSSPLMSMPSTSC